MGGKDEKKLTPEEKAVDVAVMEYIRYCEAKNILNEACNLSTIEGLKLCTPEKIQEHLKDLQKRCGKKVACPKCDRAMTFDKKYTQYYCASCNGWLRHTFG